MLRHEIGYIYPKHIFMHVITRWTVTYKTIYLVSAIYALLYKYN
jgi:hypothetical protein